MKRKGTIRNWGMLVLMVAIVVTLTLGGAFKGEAATSKKKTIFVGQTYQLKQKTTKFTFKTSKKKVAKVTKKGLVTGVKAGKAVITVKKKSNKKLVATYKLTVKKGVLPKKIALQESTKEITIGDTCMLAVSKWTPAKASVKTLTYTTNKKSVATVSKDGEVTGVAEGIAKITVKTFNKKKAVCTVTVKPPVPVEQTDMYKQCIQQSLVSTGNNFRVKKAIAKARAGEKTVLAYIGGSITEGANATTPEQCYAYQSYLDFKTKYGKDGGANVVFVNAGMSGTPSTLGMIRYFRDVEQKISCKPDIVFVEFSVNDADDPTYGKCFESLCRNILKDENSPACVLVFSIFKSRWNLQDRLQPVGEYYNLPMVSIYDGIKKELDMDGSVINDDYFFSDIYHPTDEGHRMMADCITNLFDKIDAEAAAAADIAIPATAKIGNDFDGVQMLDAKSTVEGITIEKGSFSATDTELGTFKYDNKTKTFPDNWQHVSGNDPLKVTLTCKNFLIVYKKSAYDEFGTAEVYVDGKKVKDINAYQSGGWNNPYTLIAFKETEAAQHTIEIRMKSGDESKKFSVLAFGYTK